MAERRSTSETKRSSTGAPRLNQAIAAEQPIGFELPPVRVPKAFVGFIDFIRTQGVVGLGVGFVVGTAANALIKSIVTNLLNPFIGFLTGGINLSQKTACISSAGSVCKNTLSYGQVISDGITFLAILIVVYVVVKGLKLDRLDKQKK